MAANTWNEAFASLEQDPNEPLGVQEARRVIAEYERQCLEKRIEIALMAHRNMLQCVEVALDYARDVEDANDLVFNTPEEAVEGSERTVTRALQSAMRMLFGRIKRIEEKLEGAKQ